MSSNLNSRYTAINLGPEAADGLRRLTAQLTAAMGRRITHTETLTALLKIANGDPEALPQALAYVRANRPTT